MTDGIILRASVRIDNTRITKAVRFDVTTTVKEAKQQIAEKCALSITEQELATKYVLCVLAKLPKESNKYLPEVDSLLLEGANFTDRDEIELRRVTDIRIQTDEGEEILHKQVDTEQSVLEFMNFLCKFHSYESALYYELSVQRGDNSSPTVLLLHENLRDQGVSSETRLIINRKQKGKRSKKKVDKKAPSLVVSEPVFVRSSRLNGERKGLPIFKQPLNVALLRPGDEPDLTIPDLVSAAIQYIEDKALDVEGIFRVSAKSWQVDEMKEKYDDNSVEVDFSDVTDPHLVCSILKQYLRDLPEPVVPFKLYSTFLDLSEENETELKDSLAPLLKELPQPNYYLLRTLMAFLRKVAQHEDKNKMGVWNLATVMGPNVLRYPEDSQVNVETLMFNFKRVATITSALIKFEEELFSDRPLPPPRDYRGKRSTRKHTRRLKAEGYVRAFHDYHPSEGSECEISFTKGSIIVVFANPESGWWVGSVLGSNVAGFFPSNFCSELSTNISTTPPLPNEGSDETSSQTVSFEPSTESDAQRIARLESEVRLLREQLAQQKELTELERQKRKQFELDALQNLEKFSQIINSHLNGQVPPNTNPV